MIGAAEIEAQLRASGTRERAEHSTGYTPSSLRFYGVDAKQMRALARAAARERKGDPEAVIALAQELVDGGSFDGRQVGYLLFERNRAALEALSLAAIARLGAGMDNWASVDAFACTVSGPAWNLGVIDDAAVLRWARSDDLWWRRAALASTVALNKKSRGGSGDAPRTLAVCELLVDDHEDMIIKGMSWALRSLVQWNRGAVERFLREHEGALAKRVLREVRKKLATGKKN